MTKDIMVEALKPLLKKNNFKKTRTTWHKVIEDFILVINVQGSQWGEDYYINLGVYFKALGTELNPPENLCHIQARLAHEDKSVEAIVEEAINWLNTYGNISVLESLHRENKLPPMTFVKAKEYLDSRLHLRENKEM